MPAPQPIRFQYGDPVLLSNLAAGAGSARARRDSAQRAYQMQLQQMAQDQSLLQSEMARRNRPAYTPQQNPTMLSDAAGYGGPIRSVRKDTPGNEIQRFAVERQQQQGGLGYMPQRPDMQGQSLSKATLVPREGPIPQGPRPSARIYERGTGQTIERFPEGSVVMSGSDAIPQDIQSLRELDPRFNANQQQMVTPEIRQQLDAVRAMQGSIPDEQYRMLEAAASSGQMDMNQLVDDARQALPSSASSRLTPTVKQREKAQADNQMIRILDRGTAQDRALFAERSRLFEPEELDMFSRETESSREEVKQRNIAQGEAAYKSWKTTQEQLAQAYDGDLPMAQSTPVDQVGGVQSVQTEDDAMRLPVGTRFRLPDGRTGVRE